MEIELSGDHLVIKSYNAGSSYNKNRSYKKKRVPLTIYGFHLQFAESTCNLRIPLVVADSATAQFN